LDYNAFLVDVDASPVGISFNNDFAMASKEARRVLKEGDDLLGVLQEYIDEHIRNLKTYAQDTDYKLLETFKIFSDANKRYRTPRREILEKLRGMISEELKRSAEKHFSPERTVTAILESEGTILDAKDIEYLYRERFGMGDGIKSVKQMGYILERYYTGVPFLRKMLDKGVVGPQTILTLPPVRVDELLICLDAFSKREELLDVEKGTFLFGMPNLKHVIASDTDNFLEAAEILNEAYNDVISAYDFLVFEKKLSSAVIDENFYLNPKNFVFAMSILGKLIQSQEGKARIEKYLKGNKIDIEGILRDHPSSGQEISAARGSVKFVDHPVNTAPEDLAAWMREVKAKGVLSQTVADFQALWSQHSHCPALVFPETLIEKIVDKISILDSPILLQVMFGDFHPDVIAALKNSGVHFSPEEENFIWRVFQQKYPAWVNRDYYLLDQRDFIGEFLKSKPVVSLLDIGSGSNGEALAKIKELYGEKLDAVGLDMNIDEENIARQYGVKLVQGDVRRMEFDNDSFDIINEYKLMGYFPSLHETVSILREIMRVLRVNGVFIFTDSYNFYKDEARLRTILNGLGYEVNIQKGMAEALYIRKMSYKRPNGSAQAVISNIEESLVAINPTKDKPTSQDQAMNARTQRIIMRNWPFNMPLRDQRKMLSILEAWTNKVYLFNRDSQFIRNYGFSAGDYASALHYILYIIIKNEKRFKQLDLTKHGQFVDIKGRQSDVELLVTEFKKVVPKIEAGMNDQIIKRFARAMAMLLTRQSSFEFSDQNSEPNPEPMSKIKLEQSGPGQLTLSFPESFQMSTSDVLYLLRRWFSFKFEGKLTVVAGEQPNTFIIKKRSKTGSWAPYRRSLQRNFIKRVQDAAMNVSTATNQWSEYFFPKPIDAQVYSYAEKLILQQAHFNPQTEGKEIAAEQGYLRLTIFGNSFAQVYDQARADYLDSFQKYGYGMSQSGFAYSLLAHAGFEATAMPRLNYYWEISDFVTKHSDFYVQHNATLTFPDLQYLFGYRSTRFEAFYNQLAALRKSGITHEKVVETMETFLKDTAYAELTLFVQRNRHSDSTYRRWEGGSPETVAPKHDNPYFIGFLKFLLQYKASEAFANWKRIIAEGAHYTSTKTDEELVTVLGKEQDVVVLTKNQEAVRGMIRLTIEALNDLDLVNARRLLEKITHHYETDISEEQKPILVNLLTDYNRLFGKYKEAKNEPFIIREAHEESFTVLGVMKNLVTASLLAEAYRNQMKANHPDAVGGNVKTADEIAKTINNAREELRKALNAKVERAKARSVQFPDQAMVAKENEVHRSDTGGIDLTSDKALSVQNNGQGIKFRVDPAMLEQLQNAPGFTPVIISIQPMTNIRAFLGLKEDPQSIA